MTEFERTIYPEKQRQQAELEESMQLLAGVVDYLMVYAPDDPLEEGRKVYTSAIDQDCGQLDTFTPFQHVASITISTEKPDGDVELRDDYVWTIRFNIRGGITQLYASPPEDSTSIVIYTEDIDKAGNPILPHGFVGLSENDEGSEIIPTADAVQYIYELARFLFDRVEPAQP